LKAAASILFAFLLLWHPATTANAAGTFRGGVAITCAGCCCCPAPASESSNPLAPVPSRPATEQLTLLLPTITASVLLEQLAQSSHISSLAEFSYSAGALPLFRRDCALLL
jgi:hypothetical protein